MVQKHKPPTSAILLPVFEDAWREDTLLQNIDQEIGSILSQKADYAGFTGRKGEIVSVFAKLSDFGFAEVFLLGTGKRSQFTPLSFQETIAVSLRKISTFKVKKVTLFLIDRRGLLAFDLGKLLSEALYLSQYSWDTYKLKKQEPKQRVEELDILLYPQEKQSASDFEKEYDQLKKGSAEGKRIAQGVYMARDFVNEPAAHLSPAQIASEAKKIAAGSKGTISLKILERDECEKLGMGCFLAVAKGSDTEPKFIILHYKGNTTNRTDKTNKTSRTDKIKKICLIGKTIIFDSGGLSIKPAKSMETMKIDMAGGAAVLGIFKLLATSTVSAEVYGILPACENMISGKATRPGDIAVALNGTSVEILNTDAEGRLALADALSYAEKYIKPDIMIDLATLTGAIMVALGDDIAGLFTNDENLRIGLEKAAKSEGELLWNMPLHRDYGKKMKSSVADLKNISASSYGGAITAAVFLNEFVKKTKWAHLDIAATAFNEGGAKGMTPSGATGWGVKTVYRWLKDNFK